MTDKWVYIMPYNYFPICGGYKLYMDVIVYDENMEEIEVLPWSKFLKSVYNTIMPNMLDLLRSEHMIAGYVSISDTPEKTNGG